MAVTAQALLLSKRVLHPLFIEAANGVSSGNRHLRGKPVEARAPEVILKKWFYVRSRNVIENNKGENQDTFR
jgi:hypothetical protein